MKQSAILYTSRGGALLARLALEPGSDDGQLSQDSHKGKRSYHVKHSSYVWVFFVKSQIKQCYQGRYEDKDGDQIERARPDADLDIAPDQGVDGIHGRLAPAAARQAPVPLGGAVAAESAMAMFAGSYRVRLGMIETSHRVCPANHL